MALDLNKVKERLNSLRNKNSKSAHLWKPTPGKSIIRIVPYKFNSDSPFIELYFHYNFNNKTYLSPSSVGKPDPIVEFASKLKKTGDKEDWKQGKQLEPKMRTYVPILVRGQEKEGVKFWGFGKEVYEQLLGYISEPEYGDITDPSNGSDIIVEFKEAKETGKNFPETKILIRRERSPITNDKEIIAKVKEQKNILELFTEPTYEELEKALSDYLNPEKDNEVEQQLTEESSEAINTVLDEPATEKEEVKETKPKAATKPVATSKEDIAAEFDEMFNN